MRVIERANIIEAYYYLKEDPQTTFTLPVVTTKILRGMVTQEEQDFLDTFNLTYNHKR